MKTVSACDGAEALRRFDEAAPDLVVLDIGMPEMDGLEVCRRIRKTSDAPILFLSARDEEIDRVIGLEIGGDDYVTKPFSPRELVARVNAILKRAQARPCAGGGAAVARRSRPRSERACRDLPDAAGRLDGDRIRNSEDPARAPRHGVHARPDSRCGLWRRDPCRRSHDRQPHPQHSREIRRSRLRQCDRDGAWRRLPHRSLRGERLIDRPSNIEVPRKWRPSVGLIVSLVMATALALPLAGLFFFRIYENQLIHQTESELIGQSAAIAAVMRREIETRAPANIRSRRGGLHAEDRSRGALHADHADARSDHRRHAGTKARGAARRSAGRCRLRRARRAPHARPRRNPAGHARRLSAARSQRRRDRRTRGDRPVARACRGGRRRASGAVSQRHALADFEARAAAAKSGSTSAA